MGSIKGPSFPTLPVGKLSVYPCLKTPENLVEIYGEKAHSIHCCIEWIALSKTLCEEHGEHLLKEKIVQSIQPSSYQVEHSIIGNDILTMHM